MPVSQFQHKQPTRFNAPEIPQDLATKAYVDAQSIADWQLIHRSTLGADTDDFDTGVFTGTKYIRIYWDIIASGEINLLEMNFNDDFTVAYSQRLQDDFGAPTSAASQDKLFLDVGFPSSNLIGQMGSIVCVNIGNREKIVFMTWWNKTTTGAGALANIRQGLGAWTNTVDQITRIAILNLAAGDIAAGSEIVVFGSD